MDVSDAAHAAVETASSERALQARPQEPRRDRDFGSRVTLGEVDGPSDRLVIMCDRRDWGGHTVRGAIAHHCAGRVPAEQIADAQLVASELLNNALQHGAAGLITVSVAISRSGVTVTVTSTEGASRLPPPDTWSFPDPSVPTGRGLPIVRALASSVEVHRTSRAGIDDRDWVVVTARLGPSVGSDQLESGRWWRYLGARVPFWVALVAAVGVVVGVALL